MWAKPPVWEITTDTLSRRYKEDRLRVADHVAGILESWSMTSLRWFIESGTLIGAWRNNGQMLAHDNAFQMAIYIPRPPKSTPVPAAAADDNDDEWDLAVLHKLCYLLQGRGGGGGGGGGGGTRRIRARIVVDRAHGKKVEIYDPAFGKYWLDKDRTYDYHNVTVDLTLLVAAEKSRGDTTIHSHAACLSHAKFKTSDIYPTLPIVFEGRIFPAPQNTEKFLKICFD